MEEEFGEDGEIESQRIKGVLRNKATYITNKTKQKMFENN